MSCKPRSYTDEQKQAIILALCQCMVDGCGPEGTDHTLAAACRQIGISRLTVYDWRRADASLNKQLDQAWEMAIDATADDVIRIADREDLGATITNEIGKDGFKTTTKIGDRVERAKHRTYVRLQLISRMSTRYGNRTVLAGDKDAPLFAPSARTDYSDEQLEHIITHGRLPEDPEHEPDH